MAEEWREIPGLIGYRISSNGQIVHKGKTLKPDYQPSNPMSYPRVRLDEQAGYARVFVHILVMLTFVGPKLPWHQVNHKNGDKGDPRLENLEYVTSSQNHKHSYDTLGRRRNTGSIHGMARLTEDQAKAIIAARPCPYGHKHAQRGQPSVHGTAKRFGVSDSTVYKLWEGLTWKHLHRP